MYLSIIILPLLGSLYSGFTGRILGIYGSRIISSLSIILTTILAVCAFFEVGFNHNTISVVLFNWLVTESINILWTFQFDSLTVSMLIPVLIISSLVHIYSIGYMSHDPHSQRFFSYLSLFTFMMIILVTADNYLLMFVGWEGVGVCSYLLVNFWFTRIAANQSSISAFLTNRVGDCFLTLGIFGLLWCVGNGEYSVIFSLSSYINGTVVSIIGIFLLIGAMAKSSQIGLHVWLPQAMEGPTPVSALIHAATMVTAGVYLLIRSSPFIEYSPTLLLICLWLGAVTTVFSSIIGLFQGDIKKIIAYSTMSQLAREYIIHYIFRHQTICVKVVIYFSIFMINSQITKARDNNHYNIYFFNSSRILLNMSKRWEINIIRKLVGISEAIRLILIFRKFHSLYTFFSINTSFTIPNETSKNTLSTNNLSFNEWLAGLIDGDGYFLLTKKGYNSCEITMDTRDKKALTLIKNKYGGSIKQISNANAFKYKLRHRVGLTSLINDVNGLIRNPTRLLQMNKLCLKFNIELKNPNNLNFNNGWLSGFLDSDGSIYFNEDSGQVFIGITQKNKYLLDPLISIYGGRVDILSPKIEAFKYVIYRKSELFNLIDNYFNKYPLQTEKMKRIHLIKEFYTLRMNRNNNINEFNKWIQFKDKWEKYKN